MPSALGRQDKKWEREQSLLSLWLNMDDTSHLASPPEHGGLKHQIFLGVYWMGSREQFFSHGKHIPNCWKVYLSEFPYKICDELDNGFVPCLSLKCRLHYRSQHLNWQQFARWRTCHFNCNSNLWELAKYKSLRICGKLDWMIDLGMVHSVQAET